MSRRESESPSARPQAPIYVGTPTPGEITVRNGYLGGDMGSIVGYSGAATRHEAYSDTGYTYVRLDAVNAQGWMMLGMSINGPLDQAFAPGARYSTVSAGPQAVTASGIGCSGPSEGNWTFDTSPDDIEVEVSEGTIPGTAHVAFRATFSTQVTTGSFDVTVR